MAFGCRPDEVTYNAMLDLHRFDVVQVQSLLQQMRADRVRQPVTFAALAQLSCSMHPPNRLADAHTPTTRQVRPCRLTYTKLARALWNANQPGSTRTPRVPHGTPDRNSSSRASHT